MNKRKLSTKHILLFLLLCSLLFGFLNLAKTITVNQNVIVKLRDVNAQFTIGNDLTFDTINVNSSHVWLNQSYSFKEVTGFLLWVQSPNDTTWTIDRWFPSDDDTAELTLTSPTDGTDVILLLYSPDFTNAYTSVGTISETFDGNTLNMTIDGTGSVKVIIYGVYGSTTINKWNPENYNIDITNYEDVGGDKYVFAQEKYYYFEATYWDGDGYEDLDTMKIAFSDGYHWINATYVQSTGLYSLENGSDYVDMRGGEGITAFDNQFTVTFSIYFTDEIIDANDVDIYMWSNDTSGNIGGWEVKETDYFSIYHLGGTATLQTSGTAGRHEEGGMFSLYAENNSWAQANVTFRNLQHYGTVFSIWQANQRSWDDWETDTITISMGIDYSYGGAWIQGWELRLEQEDGWLDANEMRLTWNVEWWYHGSLISSDIMNSFPMANSTGDTGIPASTSFYVDFWFNKINASTTIGGRVTAEYYAMIDNSWTLLRWATGTNWGVEISNVTQKMFFADLEDSLGNVISSKEIDMMRVWVRLEQGANDNDVRHELRDFDTEAFTVAEGDMRGINTPEFQKTKTPDMPQGGLLAGLWGLLNSIGNWIVSAFAGLANMLIGGIDALIYQITGQENMFSTFISGLQEWLGNVIVWLTNLISQIGNLATTIANAFTWFGYFITNALNLISWFFTNVVYLIILVPDFFISIFTGGSVNVPFTDVVWDFGTGLGQFVTPFTTVVGVFIALMLIKYIISGGSIFQMPHRIFGLLSGIKDIFDSLFWIIEWFWQKVREIHGFILRHIPFFGGA